VTETVRAAAHGRRADAAMIAITSDVVIRADEISFAASRSSGPGGQNVNKVSTKVTVRFDVAASPSLTEEQKRRIRERLATRVSREGVLRVSSQRERSQSANRETATARLIELLREALAAPPPRRPTRVSRAARERRIAAKKLHGARKRDRATRPAADD
jgi:ribosome-associated protein